jgi:MYXO-CTERM domain-containing protein
MGKTSTTIGKGFAVLLASTAIVAGPVTPAQSSPAEVTYVPLHQSQDRQDEQDNGDNDQGNWGLLGLIGLVGLVGLVRRGRRGDYLAGPAATPPATRHGDK